MVIRRAVACAGAVGLLGVAACSFDGSAGDPSVSERITATSLSGEAPTSSQGLDYPTLARGIEPWVPEGWELQRAYRQPAALFRSDVELVAVYLRPTGDDPSPEVYLDQAVEALRSIASGVFAADAAVTAIDVCLQHSNDAEPNVDVDPAIQILGLREDLDPLLAAEVQLADLIALSRDRRLVLFTDEYVRQAPTWSDAMATTSTTSP